MAAEIRGLPEGFGIYDFELEGWPHLGYNPAAVSYLKRSASCAAGRGKGKAMRDPDCLFCRIAAGEIPSRKVYEDSEIFAFEDINPQAPVHILIIPKDHFPTVADVPTERLDLIGRVIGTANRLAEEKHLDAGYRLVFNCRKAAGQDVFHVHLHLLGGRRFHWPPG